MDESPTKMSTACQFMVMGFVFIIAILFMTIVSLQTKVEVLESRQQQYLEYTVFLEIFNAMFDEKMQGKDVSIWPTEPVQTTINET